MELFHLLWHVGWFDADHMCKRQPHTFPELCTAHMPFSLTSSTGTQYVSMWVSFEWPGSEAVAQVPTLAM